MTATGADPKEARRADSARKIRPPFELDLSMRFY